MNEVERAIVVLKKYHDLLHEVYADYSVYSKAENYSDKSLELASRANTVKHSVDTAITCMEKQLNNRWIPISERLPENGDSVDVTARRIGGARGYFIYKAHYVAPHTQTTEDYGWDSDSIDTEYDEANDCFWVPECWYEDNAISDNGNYILDGEFEILAWRELSEPYKEGKQKE